VVQGAILSWPPWGGHEGLRVRVAQTGEVNPRDQSDLLPAAASFIL
jgi:hypothetical protein